MREFEWIGKLMIGALGTVASVALDNVSTIFSIIAAIFTIIFLIYNIKYLKVKMDGVKDNNEHQKLMREKDVEEMKEKENA